MLLARAATAQEWDALLDQLANRDYRVRSRAYTALRNKKHPSMVPALVARAPQLDVIGQNYVVMLLEMFPTQVALRGFRDLASAKPPYLRLCAGSALLRAGKPKEGLPLIRGALSVDGLSTVEFAYLPRKLELVRHVEVQAALRALLRPGVKSGYLGPVLRVLAKQGDPVAPVKAMTLWTDKDVDVVASSAAFCLGSGSATAMAELVLLRSIRDAKLTFSGMYNIADMLPESVALSNAVLDAMTERIKTIEHNYARARWMRFVAARGHRAILPVLRAHLDHEDEYTAKAALEELNKFAGAVDDKMLRTALQGKSIAQRIWAAELLRRRDDYTGLPVVVAALRAPLEKDRSAAAWALSNYRRPNVVTPLLAAMDDDSLNVRRGAAFALSSVWGGLFPYRTFDIKGTGYDADADKAGRRAGLDVLRAWWDKNKDADW